MAESARTEPRRVLSAVLSWPFRKASRLERPGVSCRVHLGHPVFLFFAAFIAGVLNSVAGGGSFISFPALLFSGILPISANATSTVALWPGGVASAVAYRKQFTPEARRLLPPLLTTGVIGGVLGARILLITPQTTFLHIVPWLILGATLMFIVSGRVTTWLRRRAGLISPGQSLLGVSDSTAEPGSSVTAASGLKPAHHKASRLMMAVGLLLELALAVYIGYFGAGVGILTLALLALLGMENIHAMNGVKTVLVCTVNGVAIVTFILAGVIAWPPALLMVVGASVGGYTGAYYAQKTNPQYIRWVVIAVGFAISIYFFIRY
jgi:uncharacterized membrane protein YfcA